jgi:single-strand DNA-binding protein
MPRSLNKVTLIGNLTRDPELRYTPQGTAVCSFGLATNRQWTTESGERKEDVEFHRIVAWNKLAEICAQLLKKGRKVYVEGRLQTRSWTEDDNLKRTQTEVVISEMIVLDSKGLAEVSADFDIPEEKVAEEVLPEEGEELKTKKGKKEEKKKKKEPEKKEASKEESEEVDIPF